MKISFIFASALLVFSAAISNADVVQVFETDSTAGFAAAGNSYSRALNGLVADGVTFDATLTITGFDSGLAAQDVNVASTGVGVEGIGSDLVNDGERMNFMMLVSNEIGGTVTFNGFTEIDFNFLSTPDSAVLSLDNSELSANFFSTSTTVDMVDISGTSPTDFWAIAVLGTTASVENSFRIKEVSARFTGVASVPEPGTFGVLALSAICLVRRRRR